MALCASISFSGGIGGVFVGVVRCRWWIRGRARIEKGFKLNHAVNCCHIAGSGRSHFSDGGDISHSDEPVRLGHRISVYLRNVDGNVDRTHFCPTPDWSTITAGFCCNRCNHGRCYAISGDVNPSTLDLNYYLFIKDSRTFSSIGGRIPAFRPDSSAASGSMPFLI